MGLMRGSKAFDLMKAKLKVRKGKDDIQKSMTGEHKEAVR